MTRRERRAVGRILTAAVEPRGTDRGVSPLGTPFGATGADLPPVAQTDAVDAFGAWLRAAPAANRVVLRLLLRVAARGDVERRVESGRGVLGGATQFLARIAAHCYYGDEVVMRRLGYDARAVAARGLALRRAEGRL